MARDREPVMTLLKDIRLGDYDLTRKIDKKLEQESNFLATRWSTIASRVDIYTPPSCATSGARVVECARGTADEKTFSDRLSAAFDLANEQPYNAYLLNEIACLLQSLVEESDHTSFLNAERARPIAAGQTGVVARGAIRGAGGGAPPFVVKVAKSSDSIQGYNSALNELLVSLFCLNGLRYEIPNFVFPYGGFYAPPPLIERDEKDPERIIGVTLYGGEGAYSLHTMIESIPGPTLFTWLKSESADDARLYSVICQVLLALAVARERFNFSHSDLHSSNILIRFLPEMRTITYTFEDGSNYHIVTDVIATMIDFGLSTALIPLRGAIDANKAFIAEKNGKKYLRAGTFLPSMEFSAGRTNSLYDVSRFLSSILKFNRTGPGSEWFDLFAGTDFVITDEWIYDNNGFVPSGIDIDLLDLFRQGVLAGIGIPVYTGDPTGLPPPFSCVADSCNHSISSEDNIILPTKTPHARLLQKESIPIEISYYRVQAQRIYEKINKLIAREDDWIDRLRAWVGLGDRRVVELKAEVDAYFDLMSPVQQYWAKHGGLGGVKEYLEMRTVEEIRKQLN